jgi:exopolysaccharide biosynthesis protein
MKKYKIIIKIFLILTLLFIMISCSENKLYTTKTTIIDSTLIDTPVSDYEARDYLKDTIK